MLCTVLVLLYSDCYVLTVRLPPQIVVHPQPVILYASDTVVNLQCEAQAVPQVEYSWTKNGMPFSLNKVNVLASKHTGSFRFDPATTLNEGW